MLINFIIQPQNYNKSFQKNSRANEGTNNAQEKCIFFNRLHFCEKLYKNLSNVACESTLKALEIHVTI